MGLDMFIYKASKPKIKSGIYQSTDEIFNDLICLKKEHISKNSYSQLLPFCEKIPIVSYVFDKERISKDYCLDIDVQIATHTKNGIIFTDGNKKTDVITNEELEFCYKKEQIEMQYITKLEEQFYWRKEYVIQNAIHEIISKTENMVVQNCGFYFLTDKIIETIKDIDKEFTLNNSKNLFYHEWY